VNSQFEPETLQEVVVYFSDPKRAFDYVRRRRWPNGTICPRCGSKKAHLIESRMIWRCNGCRKQFSVKVGTIFEDSPIPFSKWLPAMWLIANCKNGISSYELHRALKVTQKTAWFMLHRIRLALQEGTFEKLGGEPGSEVEIDETYIGGLSKNMHEHKRAKRIRTPGVHDKQAVFGMIERGGKVRTYHVPNAMRRELYPRILANVDRDAKLFSDRHKSYFGLDRYYSHEMVDHAYAYVLGRVHTNNLENYWSLLKRTIKGTYVSVEPFHLWRYLDEQSFRYNTRKGTDAHRFYLALPGAFGRRLTYNALTGKDFAAAGNGAN
jgi:transposase-like protein